MSSSKRKAGAAVPTANANALRESEARFRELADNISQFAWTADATGWRYWYNKRWYDYTGTTLEEMQGWGWQKVHHPEHVDRVVQRIRHSFETGTPWEDTFPLRGRDGNYRWFLSRALPIRNEAGEVVRWFGTNTDVTEQIEAEQALRESEARFRELADNISQFAWTADQNGWIYWYNKRWHDYTGTTLKDMEGWGWQKVHHPDHVDRVVQRIMESFETGTPWEDTFPLRGRDGNYRWFLSRALPIRNEAGEVVRWFGTNTDVTEQIEAEQALRESEARFRELADNISQFAWTADQSGWIYWYNKRWHDYTGTTLKEMEGWGWQKVHHPDHVDRVVQRIQESFETGTPWEDTFPLRGRDGSYRWFLSRALPIRNEAGEVIRWFGTNTDITEQIEAQKALRDSEARFRELADNISQFAWTADQSGRRYWYNKRWHDYTGMTPKEMEGWGWQKVHHPDHVDRVVRRMKQSFESGTPWEDTFPLRGRDGRYRWFLSRALPIRDDNGNVVRWFGTNTDITEQIDAEKALRDSEARFRELADNISQFAWTADQFGWIYWYNKRWYDYTGTTLEEMQGWGWQKVHHPEHVERVVGRIRQSFESGEPWEDTFPLRGRDGNYRWFLSRALPIRNEAGEVVRWFGTNTDITEQIEAEKALRELNETLEQRVEAETRERLQIWDASRDLLVVANLEGTYLNVNPAWMATLGWFEAELLGKSSRWLLHPDDVEKTRTEIGNLAAGQRTLRFENTL